MMSKPRESAAAVRWREIVRGYAASGLSVAAYCRRARVSQASFYSWRRKLRDAEDRAAPRRQHRLFAEVRVTVEPNSARDDGALEVRLSRGRCVIVRPGFDRQTFRDLVATLEDGNGDVVDREAGV